MLRIPNAVFIRYVDQQKMQKKEGTGEIHGSLFDFIRRKTITLLQALEQPHAPEAVAAGDGVGVAVLFELLGVQVFAG